MSSQTRFYPDFAGERREVWSNFSHFILFYSGHLKSKENRGFLRTARGGRVVIFLLLPNSSQGKECFEDIFSCKCDVTSKMK